MKRDTEVEAVITRSMSAAEIMDLTGHNKGSLYAILDRLIRENKIKKTGLRYAPTGYSDKPISNTRDEFFSADPFNLSGLRKSRGIQSKLRKMQTKNTPCGTMQGLAATDKRDYRRVRWG